MKRFQGPIFAAVLAVCLLLAFFILPETKTLQGKQQLPDARTLPNAETVTQEVPVATAPPQVSADSAIVIDARTGRVLYEKNPHAKAYPASTTKIMTALLAVEEGDLDRMVKVPSNAEGVEGSSIYLASGETLSLRDLLYGLMLRSGNDASLAIAETIKPSTADFVERMNERAIELGATDTHFVNPNGLFHKDHYTSAFDMSLIAKAAMSHPEFRAIVGAKSWKANRATGKYNYFYNKNKVVFEYQGGNGIKIGYTKASGRTLVASSTRGDMSLICVVMQASNWFNDSYHLMDYIYNTYEMTTIAKAERVLKAIPVTGSDRGYVMIGPKDSVVCPMKKGEQEEIAIAYDVPTSVHAPVHRWEPVGELQVIIGGELLYTQPLYYLEDVM